MFAFEPGPLELGELPLGPRVSDAFSFLAIGAALDGIGGQADAVLIPSRVDTADAAASGDLTGAYAAILGPAEEAHAEEASAGPDATLATAAESGDVVPAYHAQVAGFLPPPDARVPTAFLDPPDPPQAYGVSNPAVQGAPEPSYEPGIG